jgi:hypothetical protein
MTKICNKCKQSKDANTSNFQRDKSRKDGLRRLCKLCCSTYYKPKDKEKVRLRDKKYREKNIEKIKIKQAEKRLKNKEYYKRKHAEYYLKNKERLNAYSKEYQQKNKAKILAKALEYTKRRRKEDIKYRIKLSLRARLHEALKGNSKSSSTIKLLGCTLDELKLYLQDRFTKNMNWNNYGDWHIDHIKPCDSFDLTKDEEQKKCFHYSNLQPLWALENLKKGSNV